MKIFIILMLIGIVNIISANALNVIEDGIKFIKGTENVSCANEINLIAKAGRLSKININSLSASKIDNIQNLMSLAVKEKRVRFEDQFRYITEYKSLKNGDKLLLKCLKKSNCDLQKYTNNIKNTYIGDKVKTVTYTIKGFVNDNIVHKFIDGNGNILKAKISEVVDLKRTIKMPYVGSTSKNSNATGYMRDSKFFWNEYRKRYPEVLSNNNINRINSGLSPIVDKQWIKFNPNHKTFLGEILEHHHLNNNSKAVGIPQSLHRGQTNKELVHVD